MADVTQLAEGLIGYWNLDQNFDEHIQAHNLVPPHLNPLSASPYLEDAWPTSGSPLVGAGGSAEYSYDFVNQRLAHDSDTMFQLGAADKSLSMWFRLNLFSDVHFNYLILTSFGYQIYVNSSRQLVFQTPGGTITHPTVLSTGTKYCLTISTDAANATATVGLNGVFTTGTALGLAVASEFLLGSDIDANIDEFAIWDRQLSTEEALLIYNDGSGIAYEDIVPPTPAFGEECRASTCCPQNDFEYSATRGSGNSYASACFPAAQVEFTPQPGEVVIMPTLVVLRSTVDGATIRYTTDGSDPDASSTEYTSPLTVDSPTTEIRARCFVEGCPDGPVASASYQQYTSAGEFTFACDTPDEVGAWGVFVPNGENDYHWRLEITFPSITSITQLDVLQLDANGEFTTGQIWSTNQFPAQMNGYESYPLLLKIGGVAQNNAYTTDYSGTFGTFAATTHTIDLYGQINTTSPLGSDHSFMLLLSFANGSQFSRVAKVVNSNCSALFPPCNPADDPTLTASCTGVSVQTTVPVGATYGILRSRPPGPFSLIHSDTSAASPQTYDDTTAVLGATYSYLVFQTVVGCPSKASSVVSVTMPNDPAVSIAATPSTIDPGDSAILSWSSQFIAGATVNISPTVGNVTSNVAGSQSVSPAVTTIYTLTGVNACSTQQATATVTVRSGPSCGDTVFPHVIEIVGFTTFLFDVSACSLGLTSALPWNGRFARVSDTGCLYNKSGTASGSIAWDGSFGQLITVSDTNVQFTGTKWQLTVGRTFGGTVIAWRGEKLTGSDPTGTYTRTAGCSATPSSLVIATV